MRDEDALTLAIERFDLDAYARDHGGTPEGRKGEWLLTCPRCGKDKLALNVRLRRWNCLSCVRYGAPGWNGKPVALEGAGGVFHLLIWMEGLSPAAAAERLLTAHRATTPDNGQIPDPDFPEPERPVVRHPTGLPENCLDVIWNLPYMQRRGITLDDARAFGLKYVPPDSGWLSNRLVFPVYENGQVLYWQARACWDEHEHVPRPWVDRQGVHHADRFRKTLNPSSERNGIHFLGSSDVIGNLEQAARYHRPVIVEGPTSGVRAGWDAVWTFGRRLSGAQVGRLIRAGVKTVDLMWDGPTPGKDGRTEGNVCSCHRNPGCAWPSMFHAAALLHTAGIDVRLVFLPHSGPGDWPRETLNWFRYHGRPFEAVQGFNTIT